MATDADGTAADVALFKAVGLDRLLRRAEDGGYGGRTRGAMLALVWLTFGYFAVHFAWLPTAALDVPLVLYNVLLKAYCIACTVKVHALVRHAARLGAVLDACRFAYTACGARRPAAMRRCRGTVARLLRTYLALHGAASAVWVATPVLWPARVSVARADGTVRRYRSTAYSWWFPLPERVHNSPPGWTAFYAVEVVSFAVSVFSSILFDCHLIATGLALDAQFRTAAAGGETLGRTPRSDDRPGILCNMPIETTESEQTNHYRDLISFIKDTQKLMKTLDEFFDVIHPAVRIQMVIGSFTVISFIFFVCLEFVTGRSLMNLLFFKYIITLIALTVQFVIYCYIFNLIETAKSSLNFGLYSCNWTEMDLRFKKTMSLAMVVNSSHKRKMKITPIYVINLEFFFKVMKASFTAIPALLKLTT